MSSAYPRHAASCPVAAPVHPGSVRLVSCMAGPMVLFLGPLCDASNGTVPQSSSGWDGGELNNGERAFVRMVLALEDVHGQPTEAQRRNALQVLSAYAQDVRNGRPGTRRSGHVERWLAPLSALDRVQVTAAAFVRFGTADPTIFQIRAAHEVIRKIAPPFQ